jgi:hypothetical protein
MHHERVVIARVSVVVVAAIIAIIAATVGAFDNLLLGHLFPIIQVIIFPSGSRPRARATIIGIFTPPIVFRLEQHLLLILPLHASDARRPSKGSRDLLINGVARCDCSDRDTPSATDASGPLDLHG